MGYLIGLSILLLIWIHHVLTWSHLTLNLLLRQTSLELSLVLLGTLNSISAHRPLTVKHATLLSFVHAEWKWLVLVLALGHRLSLVELVAVPVLGIASVVGLVYSLVSVGIRSLDWLLRQWVPLKVVKVLLVQDGALLDLGLWLWLPRNSQLVLCLDLLSLSFALKLELLDRLDHCASSCLYWIVEFTSEISSSIWW